MALRCSIALVAFGLIPHFTLAQATNPDPAPNQQIVFSAALSGQWQPIQDALDNGFPIDDADPVGRTAIMYASYNGHTPLVAQLIEAGADLNKKDQIGSTALMFASSGPFVETVALLLEKGAKIDEIDNNEHFTALMWAAAEGQTEVVELLLKHGANTTLQDIDGDTAESFASKANHVEAAKLLKDAKLARNPTSEKQSPATP